MLEQEPILLYTKLNRPHLPKDLVERTRLIERLDQEIDRQLILVCAPAGFGKTTLVVTWLEHMAAGLTEKAAFLPSAWLSLDEADSELDLFLRYLIAAIRTVYNEACEETASLLQARQQPPAAVLYATLSNELERLPGELILVLDDYHSLRGAEVHNLLAELGQHWPRTLHLVLVSRTSPPIPLDRLRARGMMSEIRTRDLRFTPEETNTYLSHSQFALMVQQVLPLLEQRFEGWAAGLHLANISMRYAGSQESVLSALSSENANITGYLVDEVLSQQLPAIHAFLLETSILDRFCAGLCEAIIGEADPAWSGRACLDWIEKSELFIIPLDNNREWYRYHHLFQELLQQRLSAEMGPEQVLELHKRASVWFEEHGLLDEALHHALAAGDLDLAARQMNSGLRDALNREDRPTLEHWLRLLPEEMIQRRPELLMMRAWALEFSWRLNIQAQTLLRVEELLESEAGAGLPASELQILRGQILALRGQQAYFSNQPTRAIELCRQVLALLPPSWRFVRGGAMLYLGMSMQASGEAAAAERLLSNEYEACSDKADIYATFLLESLGFTYLAAGQLEQTKQIAQVLLQAAVQSEVTIVKNWADWFLGVVCYQRNELEAAEEHFTQIVENRYTAQITTYRDAIAGLVLIHQIQGESAGAKKMVESISQFDLEQRGSEDTRTRSLRARLMLLDGDLEGAGAWADTLTDPPPDQVLLWLEEPQMTRARILVARGSDADLRSAQQTLDALAEIAERTHNTRYKIEVLALRALALEAEGKPSEAEAEVRRALDLAKPGGFIRVFADLGSPMQAMLERLAKQDGPAEMMQRILAAFPNGRQNREGSQRSGKTRRGSSLSMPGLAEPLTPRELEVLNLLRGPSSIKEIALKLNISYATAKRHTINLYAKLGANRRWEAVAKAEELNLLPAH